MIRYKLTPEGVIDRETMSAIPKDPRNADWQTYLEWAKTNTPEPEQTLEEQKEAAKNKAKVQLDAALTKLQSVNGDLFDLAQAIYLVDQSPQGLSMQDRDTLDNLRTRFRKITQVRQQYESALHAIDSSNDPKSIPLNFNIEEG